MRCDFYDGGVRAVILPASCVRRARVCVCVWAIDSAVCLSTERRGEGMLENDIIS